MATHSNGEAAADGDAQDTVTLTDNRTGRTYELPIRNGTITAMDLRGVKVSEEDFGLMSFDPGLTNTAICHSGITLVDGAAGILEYRGYRIEDLCERSSYLEVAYLLLWGELPTQQQLNEWTHDILHHTFVHENLKKFMEGFRHDAHPMGMLLGTVGALSTFYPEAKQIRDDCQRYLSAVRLIAKIPTLAAFAYRHILGLPYVYPDNDLSYAENLLSMLFKMSELRYEANPLVARALEVLLILHAEHEQNCSTNAVRAVGSSEADPYSTISAGIAALYGPGHGGANEAAVRMLDRIGSIDNVPAFLESVKQKKERLMGFGHRVYKNYDPRVKIIKDHLDAVVDTVGRNPRILLAEELEKRALDDDYFRSRKLYANVDFYSGMMYEALGLPTSMYTVMFAVARTAGWMSQWLEHTSDPEQKIVRPRQVYTGPHDRKFVEIAYRDRPS